MEKDGPSECTIRYGSCHVPCRFPFRLIARFFLFSPFSEPILSLFPRLWQILNQRVFVRFNNNCRARRIEITILLPNLCRARLLWTSCDSASLPGCFDHFIITATINFDFYLLSFAFHPSNLDGFIRLSLSKQKKIEYFHSQWYGMINIHFYMPGAISSGSQSVFTVQLLLIRFID